MMQGYIHMSALALGVPPSRWHIFTHAKTDTHYISVGEALKIYEQTISRRTP